MNRPEKACTLFDKPLLLKPGVEIQHVDPANEKDFKLEELYNLLECDCIEVRFPLPGVKVVTQRVRYMPNSLVFYSSDALRTAD